MWISVDGPEGCGKTTMVEGLARVMGDVEIVRETHIPRGKGQLTADLVLAYAEQRRDLIAAARSRRPEYILADRGPLSTAAHQGVSIERAHAVGGRPDLYLVLLPTIHTLQRVARERIAHHTASPADARMAYMSYAHDLRERYLMLSQYLLKEDVPMIRYIAPIPTDINRVYNDIRQWEHDNDR